jgi:hypothetical protein
MVNTRLFNRWAPAEMPVPPELRPDSYRKRDEFGKGKIVYDLAKNSDCKFWLLLTINTFLLDS